MSNVLMICGSLRKGSFNRALMNALPALAPADEIDRSAIVPWLPTL